MGYAFVPAGYPSAPTKINTLGGIVSIGLSFLFVPIYGYIGAIYALIAMNIVTAAMSYIYLLKYSINPRIKLLFKPALLLLIAPVSLLYNGEYTLLFKGLLFLTSLILAWIISDDLKSAIKLLISNIQMYKE